MTFSLRLGLRVAPESPLKALQRTDITHQTDQFDETVQQTSH